MERIQAPHKLNIRLGRLTVLLLTTFPLYDFPKQLKMVTDVIRTLSRIGVRELIIRPHPGENMPKDLAIEKPRPDFVWSWDLGKDLYKQIKRADIIVTEGTSVALLAMLWAKPVIHLVTEEVTDVTGFSRFGAAIRVNRINKLPEAIELLARSKVARQKMFAGQKKLLELFCYKLDGRSSERVALEIAKTIAT